MQKGLRQFGLAVTVCALFVGCSKEQPEAAPVAEPKVVVATPVTDQKYIAAISTAQGELRAARRKFNEAKKQLDEAETRVKAGLEQAVDQPKLRATCEADDQWKKLDVQCTELSVAVDAAYKKVVKLNREHLAAENRAKYGTQGATEVQQAMSAGKEQK